MKVTYQQLFDETMTDFTPLFARVKDSGAKYLLVILSHANSDVFVKQLYEARLPMPYGGIDVKSMTPNFCSRVNGKPRSARRRSTSSPARRSRRRRSRSGTSS